jgi:DNA polymerase III epsilon subunit-like protein
MIQIAWVYTDGNGNVIDRQAHIIRPEGFSIPVEASRVHRITTERAKREGVDLRSVLTEFNELITEAKYIVAHNISFDEKIAGAEFRKGITTRLHQKPQLCTMQASTDFCRIPGPYGYKWPKLSELHRKLFYEDFDEAHDAAADINATVKCFWELKRIGVM